MHLTRIIHILSWIQSWCISYLAYQHFSDKVPWKGSLICERDVGKKKQTCNFIRDLNYVTIMVKPRWPLPSILECRKDYKCDSANVQRCFFMSSHSLFRRLQFAKHIILFFILASIFWCNPTICWVLDLGWKMHYYNCILFVFLYGILTNFMVTTKHLTRFADM